VANICQHGNEPCGCIKLSGISWLAELPLAPVFSPQSLHDSAIKMDVYYDVALCTLVETDRRFRGACCSCRWRETMSLNCGQQLAYYSPRGDVWVWRDVVEWYRERKFKNSEKTFSHWHSVQHKSHTDWLRLEPGTPRRDTGFRGAYCHHHQILVLEAIGISVLSQQSVRRGNMKSHSASIVPSNSDRPLPFISRLVHHSQSSHHLTLC
jgi:hypothetical protein